jgi:hypothetical protein
MTSAADMGILKLTLLTVINVELQILVGGMSTLHYSFYNFVFSSYSSSLQAILEQDRLCTYNVILRCVCATM